VVPAGQSVQVLDDTNSLAEHKSGTQVVSKPDESSPASFEVPAGQSMQVFETTLWFDGHRTASHDVFPPDVSSPATFVVPGGHRVQALLNTYSLVAHVGAKLADTGKGVGFWVGLGEG